MAEQQALILKEKGNEEFKHSNYAKAIIHYTAAIQFDKSNPTLFSNLSCAYGHLKDWKRALVNAETAVLLDETYAKGYFRLATALFETDQLVAAKWNFEKAIKLEPKNSVFANALKNVGKKKINEDTRQSTKRIVEERSIDSEHEISRVRKQMELGDQSVGGPATTQDCPCHRICGCKAITEVIPSKAHLLAEWVKCEGQSSVEFIRAAVSQFSSIVHETELNSRGSQTDPETIFFMRVYRRLKEREDYLNTIFEDNRSDLIPFRAQLTLARRKLTRNINKFDRIVKKVSLFSSQMRNDSKADEVPLSASASSITSTHSPRTAELWFESEKVPKDAVRVPLFTASSDILEGSLVVPLPAARPGMSLDIIFEDARFGRLTFENGLITTREWIFESNKVRLSHRWVSFEFKELKALIVSDSLIILAILILSPSNSNIDNIIQRSRPDASVVTCWKPKPKLLPEEKAAEVMPSLVSSLRQDVETDYVEQHLKSADAQECSDCALVKQRAAMVEADSHRRSQEALELLAKSNARCESVDKALATSQKEIKKLEEDIKQHLSALEHMRKTAIEQAAAATQREKDFVKQTADQKDKFLSRETELLHEISTLKAVVRAPLSREDVGKMEDAVLKSSLDYILAEQVQRRLCVICLDSDAKILFLPCQHQKVCASCSKALTRCPYCQQVVERKIAPF